MSGLDNHPTFRFVLLMTDPALPRPAPPDEISDALAFALRYDGKRCFRGSEDAQTRIMAAHLIRHLERAGFVVLRKVPPPPGPAPEMRRFQLPLKD